MDEKLYTVGQMAKICNVTAEQLRHYDKNHILCPEGRGNDNNYRYYTERQIEDILLIKELKNLKVQLKSIADLVKNKKLTNIKMMLEESMYLLRKEIHQAQTRYDHLYDILMRLNDATQAILTKNISFQFSENQEFSIVNITKRPIVSTRYQSSYSVDDPFIYRYAELMNFIEEKKLVTNGLYLLFHDHYSKQFLNEKEKTIGDLELFSNITALVNNAETYRTFGGFKAACATHIGHYRQTETVYNELTQWATNAGYFVSGISFQELVVGRTLIDCEENYVTRIYLPLDVEKI